LQESVNFVYKGGGKNTGKMDERIEKKIRRNNEDPPGTA